MRKLLIIVILLGFLAAGCANLPSVSIKYGDVEYKRTGEQEIGGLEVTTPEGTVVKLESLHNDETEAFNKALITLLQAVAPYLPAP